jgi:hypothetical protein
MRRLVQLQENLDVQNDAADGLEQDGFLRAALSLREKSVFTRAQIEALGYVRPPLIQRARNLGHHMLSGSRKGNT